MGNTEAGEKLKPNQTQTTDDPNNNNDAAAVRGTLDDHQTENDATDHNHLTDHSQHGHHPIVMPSEDETATITTRAYTLKGRVPCDAVNPLMTSPLETLGVGDQMEGNTTTAAGAPSAGWDCHSVWMIPSLSVESHLSTGSDWDAIQTERRRMLMQPWSSMSDDKMLDNLYAPQNASPPTLGRTDEDEKILACPDGAGTSVVERRRLSTGDRDRAAAAVTIGNPTPPCREETVEVSELTEEQLQSIPLDADGKLTSIGSVLHERGQCRPCAFNENPKRPKCAHGISCQFCHLYHGKPKKKPRPSKRQRAFQKLVEADGTFPTHSSAEVSAMISPPASTSRILLPRHTVPDSRTAGLLLLSMLKHSYPSTAVVPVSGGVGLTTAMGTRRTLDLKRREGGRGEGERLTTPYISSPTLNRTLSVVGTMSQDQHNRATTASSGALSSPVISVLSGGCPDSFHLYTSPPLLPHHEMMYDCVPPPPFNVDYYAPLGGAPHVGEPSPPWRRQSILPPPRLNEPLPPWRRQSILPPPRLNEPLPPWRRQSVTPPPRGVPFPRHPPVLSKGRSPHFVEILYSNPVDQERRRSWGRW